MNDQSFFTKCKMGSQETHLPSFFLTINDDDFTKEHRIPTDIIKHFNFNEIVPFESILKTSSLGRCWCIKIESEDNNVFFRKGWSVFVEDNSLEFGDSLVLKYTGNCLFYVNIYGKNGGEKVLHSLSDDIEKTINPKNKIEQEPTSTEKFTKCHTDFECGRDSIGFDKNEKICGSSQCVEPSTRRTTVNERTGAPQEGYSFKAEGPYFIAKWTEEKGYEVEIPTTFLRAVGGELPDAVFLKDPGGRVWPVGLGKADGRVWFQNGWKHFIEYNSTIDEHFIIFRYIGNSQFDVSISNTRNKSAQEMKDLGDFGHHKKTNHDKRFHYNEENINKSTYGTELKYKNKRSTETESMSSLEERTNSGYKKKRPSGDDEGKARKVYDSDKTNQAKQQIEESSPCQRNEIIYLSSIQDEDREESLETDRHEEIEEEDVVEYFDKDVTSSSSKVSAVAKKQSVTFRKKKKASTTQLAASEFKSEYPFFIFTLRSSYLKSKYMRLPYKFYMSHLPQDLDERMILLEVPDGQAWAVNCIVSKICKNDIRLSKIGLFLSSNNLADGDICIFEAIKTNPDVVLRVHIFRHRDFD